jgi:hypothetical protein
MDLEVHHQNWLQVILEKKVSVTKSTNIIYLEHTELNIKTRLTMDMTINSEVMNTRPSVSELAHRSYIHKTKELDDVQQG